MSYTYNMPAHRKRYTAKEKAAYAAKMRRARSHPRSRSRGSIKGHGDYFWEKYNPVKQKTTWSAPAIGQAVGNAIGTPYGYNMVGSALGNLAGHAFRYFTGYGDYQIRTNSLIHPEQAEAIPSFGDSSIRVRHREIIQNAAGTTGFANTAFSVNPGIATTFPWLSLIAVGYEQYRFNGLVFQYVSESADSLNSTNTNLGRVLFASDYNALDDDFVNFQQAAGSLYANWGKPSCDLMHAIECDPNQNPTKLLYVRSGSVPSGADLRLYDLCKTQFITENMQAASDIGQLCVSYDITLTKPVMNSQVGSQLQTFKAFGTVCSGSAYFGTTIVNDVGNNLDITLTTTEIIFPANVTTGTYMIIYHVFGGSASVVDPTFTPSGMTVRQQWCNGSGVDLAVKASNTGTTSTRLLLIFNVLITDGGAKMTFSAGTLPAATNQCDVWVSQINQDIVAGN